MFNRVLRVVHTVAIIFLKISYATARAVDTVQTTGVRELNWFLVSKSLTIYSAPPCWRGSLVTLPSPKRNEKKGH